MISDTNQEAAVAPEATAGEGTESVPDTVSIPKTDWEKANQTIGSLKRQLKDLQKPKQEPETPQETKTEEFGLLQKLALKSAGVTSDDEIELAKRIKKQTGLEWDTLVEDDFFQAKLKKLRDDKANETATANLRGSNGTQSAKNTPDFYISRGSPPTRDEVPNRALRAKIARAMMDSTKNTKKFYND